MFSFKTDTVMQSSKLGYQTWAIAVYQAASNPKGISSLKLRRDRDLGITQKSAWRLMHRDPQGAFEADQLRPLKGPVEVDETFVGGKRKASKGRGPVGKTTIVAGARDRSTKQVVAHTVDQVCTLSTGIHADIQGFHGKSWSGIQRFGIIAG